MRLSEMFIVISLAVFSFTPATANAATTTGFIVAAPDRGFMGNEEARDAFAELSRTYPAELVFVTDERSQPLFHAAVKRLKSGGAKRAVVLPLYLSAAHPGFTRLQSYFPGSALPLETGRLFGQSVMAPLALAERLREMMEEDATGKVTIVDTGAETSEATDAMQRDLGRLVDAVRAEFPHHTLRAEVWPQDDEAMQRRMQALAAGTQVLPFHLDQKLDSMMSYSAYLRYAATDDVRVLEGDVTPHPAVAAWMLREAARASEMQNNRIGVVVHAHGSDFHWNETMRNAAAPLADDFLVEYAFSMGDAPSLERAVRRLEQRGAQAVVIVRVFGLERSFRDGIERFIGMDYEQCREPAAHQGHGHGGGHSAPAARLLSKIPVVTTGGLEDHRLFAAALLDRAREISEDPKNETVILVAHGVGSDSGNDHWLRLLDSLREKMLAEGGDDFRDIHVATWREDWPDKRVAAVAHVRDLVEQANRDGGRVLMIPARTTAEGPERELLPDLDFALGHGFAPHPLFVEWLREQVNEGLQQIRDQTGCGSLAGN